MNRIIILFVLYGFFEITYSNPNGSLHFENTGHNINDSCTDTLTDENGICTLDYMCPYIVEKIKKRDRSHTVCGYHKINQIVCCPTSVVSNFGVDTNGDCFDPVLKSKFTEVVGEICTDEGSGKEGKYRWTDQCTYKFNSPPKIVYSCCISVVCCPNIEYIPTSKHEFECLKHTNDVYIGEWEIEGPYSSEPEELCISYIHGGTKALKGEYPFIVALGFRNEIGDISYDCGGTIISDRYVLTAAHCLSSHLGNVLTARVGALSLNKSVEENYSTQEYLITERIPHPDYLKKSFYNDIALLRLNASIDFNLYIRPACLPSSLEVSDTLEALGWGRTETGNQSEDLLKVQLQITSHEHCNTMHPQNRRLRNGIVDETQICAGHPELISDTCQGDSGGPLVSKHLQFPYVNYIVGITSFGRGCGTAGVPGVYTRVYPYISWIESIVWPNN